MSRYCLITRDKSGRVKNLFPFLCPDDIDAIAAAEDLLDGNPTELVSADRLVRRWMSAAPQPQMA